MNSMARLALMEACQEVEEAYPVENQAFLGVVGGMTAYSSR